MDVRMDRMGNGFSMRVSGRTSHSKLVTRTSQIVQSKDIGREVVLPPPVNALELTGNIVSVV